jgi:hypothetical protein
MDVQRNVPLWKRLPRRKHAAPTVMSPGLRPFQTRFRLLYVRVRMCACEHLSRYLRIKFQRSQSRHCSVVMSRLNFPLSQRELCLGVAEDAQRPRTAIGIVRD